MGCVKTIKYKNITLSPETEIKLVKFDENHKDKRTIKIKNIDEETILDIVYLYYDMYIGYDNKYNILPTKEAGKILLELTEHTTNIKKLLKDFIKFETKLDEDLNIN